MTSSAAVDQISDFTGYGDETLQEIRLRGRLGTYRGANIVSVVNYTDENGDSWIPDDEVWVFGGTVGLFANYGGMKAKTWAENTVGYRHYRVRKDISDIWSFSDRRSFSYPPQHDPLVDGQSRRGDGQQRVSGLESGECLSEPVVLFHRTGA